MTCGFFDDFFVEGTCGQISGSRCECNDTSVGDGIDTLVHPSGSPGAGVKTTVFNISL